FNKNLLEISSKNPEYLKTDKFYYETKHKTITQIPSGNFAKSRVGVSLICLDKNIKNCSYSPSSILALLIIIRYKS
ncbi:hypothetical protein ACNO6Z_11470, partial [Aliarcobacter lanthieri]